MFSIAISYFDILTINSTHVLTNRLKYRKSAYLFDGDMRIYAVAYTY